MDKAEAAVARAMFAAMKESGYNPDEWCNVQYSTALVREYWEVGSKGGGDNREHHIECRLPKGHDGDDHWCPAQDDLEEQMLYLKQSLGIGVPDGA